MPALCRCASSPECILRQWYNWRELTTADALESAISKIERHPEKKERKRTDHVVKAYLSVSNLVGFVSCFLKFDEAVTVFWLDLFKTQSGYAVDVNSKSNKHHHFFSFFYLRCSNEEEEILVSSSGTVLSCCYHR